MTFDSNRRMLWLGSLLWLALGCGPSASTTPLSAASPGESNEGPRSDRRAQPGKAPTAAASASAEPVAVASAEPAASNQTAPLVPAKDTATPPSEDVASARGAARVELLDAGKEPRQKLRFTFRAKETLKIRIRNDMTMEMQMQDKTVRQPLPAMEMEGRVETVSVDAQGSARRRSSYSSIKFLSTPGVQPDLQKRIEKQLEGFTGITVNELVSSRGESLEQEVDLSSIKSAELKSTLEGMTDSLSQSSSPFPEEAIGVGARWRIQRVSKVRDLSLAYDTTLHLTSLKGKRVEADFTRKGSGSPALGAAKAEVAVESLTTLTSGQQRVTLDPVSIDATSNSDITTVTRMKDMTMTMRMTMKMNLSMKK